MSEDRLISFKEICEMGKMFSPETVTIPRELFERLTECAIQVEAEYPSWQKGPNAKPKYHGKFEALSETVAEAVRIRDSK